MIKLKRIMVNANGFTVFEESDKRKTGTLLVGTEWNEEFTNNIIDDYLTHSDTEHLMCDVDVENGIILGGLDWSLQIRDLLEVLTFCDLNDVPVKIEVPCDLHTLQERIGEYVAKEANGFEAYTEMIDSEGEDSVNRVVGETALDEVIGGEYYVRAGLGKDVRVYRLGVTNDN